MIKFEYLNKPDFSQCTQTLFDILSGNMTKIAPTGNTLEDDFKMWFSCTGEALQNEERQMILIKDNESIVGYFQYYTNEDTFIMEEIQFKPEYQGTGIFRELYGFVLRNINPDLKYVRANAGISNLKSIGILEHFGLENMGLNKNGRSYRFCGDFYKLVKWHED